MSSYAQFLAIVEQQVVIGSCVVREESLSFLLASALAPRISSSSMMRAPPPPPPAFFNDDVAPSDLRSSGAVRARD